MNRMIKKVAMIWLLIAGAVDLTACQPQRENEEKPVKIHQYSSPASGIFSNAYYIELEKSVVVVDATLLVSTSMALKSEIDSLGKPIAAILITHGHPDHYNGLGNLIAGNKDIPIYSTGDVLDVIRRYDVAKQEQWTPMFGDEWPKNRIFPNKVLDDKESITIEGVEFTVRNLGPGESHSDSYWTMKNGNKKYAFIGDVVLNRVHAYMADGHFIEWLKNLSTLEKELTNVTMIYPGHGESGNVELLAWEKKYINTYVAHVKELLGSKDKLDDSDKAELVSKMKEFLPNDKLEFLIALGADAVASGFKK